MQLSHHAFHAFKWSALGEAATRIIGPLVFLVLARLLVPEDFGVVAAATVVVSLSQVFSDAGLAKALIQRQDRTDDSANVVFWLNLGLGVLVVAILFAAAPWIADFFHDPRIAPVTRVLSVQILLAAFSSTHTALLQKALDFKQLFWVRLLTTGLPALASIPLALAGFGYWALVAGSVAGQLIQSMVLWRMSPWRPSWGIDRVLASELVRFGKWAMLSGLLGWFYGWMDAVVVGHFLGSHDMGLYRTGSTMAAMAFGLLTAPLLPVIYSVLCSRDTPERLPTEVLYMVVLILAIAASTLAFCLIVFRDLLLAAIGAHWAGAEQVLAVLAIVFAMSSFVLPTLEAYRAAGRPHIETVSLGVVIPIYLVIYFTMNESLDTFLDGRLYAAVLTIGIHWFLGWRYAGLSPAWAVSPLILVASLIAAASLNQTTDFPATGGLAARQSAVFAAALCAVMLLNQKRLRQFMDRLI